MIPNDFMKYSPFIAQMFHQYLDINGVMFLYMQSVRQSNPYCTCVFTNENKYGAIKHEIDAMNNSNKPLSKILYFAIPWGNDKKIWQPIANQWEKTYQEIYDAITKKKYIDPNQNMLLMLTNGTYDYIYNCYEENTDTAKEIPKQCSSQDIACTCDIQTLMIAGCKCGAMDKERQR